jgi:hypothetical protein
MAAPAGTPAKAIDYSIRAGEEALAIFAYEEAAIHWQAALEILEHRGEADVRNAYIFLRAPRRPADAVVTGSCSEGPRREFRESGREKTGNADAQCQRY